MNIGIAAKSFIVNNNKLLILKRSSDDVQKPGIWEIPGGRLEPGENPFKGISRETKEETGLNIDVVQSLNVQHFTRDDGQIITMLIFLCKAADTDVKLSHEHSDFDWVSLDQCKEKLSHYFHEEVDIFKT